MRVEKVRVEDAKRMHCVYCVEEPDTPECQLRARTGGQTRASTGKRRVALRVEARPVLDAAAEVSTGARTTHRDQTRRYSAVIHDAPIFEHKWADSMLGMI